MDPQNIPSTSSGQASPSYQPPQTPTTPPPSVQPQAAKPISPKKPFSIPKKPLLSSLIVVLAILVVFFMIKNGPTIDGRNPEVLAKQPGAGEAEVVNSMGTDQKIPDGFPSNIPVEAGNMTQGYKINYKDHATTQYTVAFTSSVPRDTIWKAYSDVMKATGYVVATSSSKELGVLQARRWNDELNISINDYGTDHLITINFIDRE
jgi:hypothetical protein